MMMRTHYFLPLFSLAASFAVHPQPQSPASGPAPVTMSAAPKITPAEKLSINGLPNAGKITETLFRGAQPSPSGYPQLKNLGIAIVVDMHNTGTDMEREKQAVESLGMRYVSMPASAINGPTDEQVAQFLKLLRANPAEKVFVHCSLGADRTGVAVAAFRITQQQWNIDQAYNEMRDFHFHTFLISMSHYVKRFPQNFAQNPVFYELRTPPPPR
jgi:tyrosine-protein phosphatase SIW14